MKRFRPAVLIAVIGALAGAALSAVAVAAVINGAATTRAAPTVGDQITVVSPTAGTVRWQDCTGSTCTTIPGATDRLYTVARGDVGKTLRVLVLSPRGHELYTSPKTGIVVPEQTSTTTQTVTINATVTQTVTQTVTATPTATTTTTSTPTTTTTTTTTPTGSTDCFASPGSCGYPDPAAGNVGLTPAQCAALPTFTLSDIPSGDYYYSGSGDNIDIYANNVTIQNYNISGYRFQLNGAQGTTFNHDCITYNGDSGANNAIYVTNDGSQYGGDTTLENSDVVAQGCPIATAATTECTGTGVVQQLIASGNGSLFNNDILVGAVEDVGIGTNDVLENSYVVANGYTEGAHTEDTYSPDGSSGMTIKHNTLLNPSYETANVFIDNGTGPCRSINNTVTGNLMAGGGYSIYACSGATGTYPFTFTNNDMVRCEGSPTHDYPGLGGSTCGTTPPSSSTDGTAFGAGGDAHGYWPGSGYFGMDANVFCGQAGQTWSGNTWDDTGAAIACS